MLRILLTVFAASTALFGGLARGLYDQRPQSMIQSFEHAELITNASI